jgi:hypothetical protein
MKCFRLMSLCVLLTGVSAVGMSVSRRYSHYNNAFALMLSVATEALPEADLDRALANEKKAEQLKKQALLSKYKNDSNKRYALTQKNPIQKRSAPRTKD